MNDPETAAAPTREDEERAARIAEFEEWFHPGERGRAALAASAAASEAALRARAPAASEARAEPSEARAATSVPVVPRGPPPPARKRVRAPTVVPPPEHAVAPQAASTREIPLASRTPVLPGFVAPTPPPTDQRAADAAVADSAARFVTFLRRNPDGRVLHAPIDFPIEEQDRATRVLELRLAELEAQLAVRRAAEGA